MTQGANSYRAVDYVKLADELEAAFMMTTPGRNHTHDLTEQEYWFVWKMWKNLPMILAALRESRLAGPSHSYSTRTYGTR